jgi:hypothetical protein
MSLSEVLPDVRALSRDDKVRLMELLNEDLRAADPTLALVPGAVYPIWSPTDAFSAAETLTKLLDAEKATP